MSTKRVSRILFLDDDTELQELVVAYFAKTASPYQFSVFSDPLDVLVRAEKEAGFLEKFDLVITDFRMPKITGMQFIHRFRKMTTQVPIILLTAVNKTELAVEAIRAGAYDFIVKPIDFAQLTVSIERALDVKRLRHQNETLRNSLKNTWTFEGIIGKSQIMQSVFDLSRKVARSNATVLINGESGTGKEVIAQAIHNASNRAKGPFVPLNCSAIPESLLESELFGYAKGAFTGAIDKKIGLFEESEGGTIFLDEIGDLNLPLQSKLLRVIQERKIKRVGENTERAINVRVITATHKDLREEVRAGRFREDLFFRLNVIQIKIPPLRERREDILPLADFFLNRFRAQNNSSLEGFSRQAREFLLRQVWPGNVRELENAIERAVILADGPLVEAKDLGQIESEPSPVTDSDAELLAAESVGALKTLVREREESSGLRFVMSFPDRVPVSLEEMCRRYSRFVVQETGGVKEKAVKILEIDRKTLYRKLAEEPVAH